MFFACCRLFHHPSIYRHIHKIHHEWTAPIGIVSIYAHPLEHLIANVLPVAMGPLVMGSHIATAWMWFSMALLTTVNTHSGYHLPFMPSPEAHDFHHLKSVFSAFQLINIVFPFCNSDIFIHLTIESHSSLVYFCTLEYILACQILPFSP